MLIKLVIFTFLIFYGSVVTISGKVFDYQPQQVHIAFGGNEKKNLSITSICTKEMSNIRANFKFVDCSSRQC